MKLRKVRLPRDAMLSNTFTLMDTSESQVFLFIENHGTTTPFGNIYISDEKGKIFTLSISNVVKGAAVDFERVNSLDGTFIVNRYAKDLPGRSGGGKMGQITEFDEADIVAEEARKGRMQSKMASNAGTHKQQQQAQEISRIPDSIAQSEVYDNVRTYITHNKGAKWELVRAPTVTSKGAPIDCHVEDDCSLHLHIYSPLSLGQRVAPVYSTESSVGVVLASGNLGKKLHGETNNLYISRDGGLTWRSVKPGTWIYEIGDHGALIVAAKINEPVTEIEFSWDEGESWEAIGISEKPIIVQNIIIEPNSLSQQFIVYGVESDSLSPEN